MAHEIPENLKYTKEHEWAEVAGKLVTVGITDFAQSSLGDIVFIELPEVGSRLTKDASFGVVESIKSVSDLYSPLSGEVTEVNSALADSPEQVNSAPYDSWLIKIEASNPSEISELLNSNQYKEVCDSN